MEYEACRSRSSNAEFGSSKRGRPPLKPPSTRRGSGLCHSSTYISKKWNVKTRLRAYYPIFLGNILAKDRDKRQRCRSRDTIAYHSPQSLKSTRQTAASEAKLRSPNELCISPPAWDRAGAHLFQKNACNVSVRVIAYRPH